MADAAERVGIAVVAEPGKGKQRHVGDGVLVARGDKCQQAPPDGQEFGRAFHAQRHPERQAHQPVAQCALEKQHAGRRSGFR